MRKTTACNMPLSKPFYAGAVYEESKWAKTHANATKAENLTKVDAEDDAGLLKIKAGAQESQRIVKLEPGTRETEEKCENASNDEALEKVAQILPKKLETSNENCEKHVPGIPTKPAPRSEVITESVEVSGFMETAITAIPLPGIPAAAIVDENGNSFKESQEIPEIIVTEPEAKELKGDVIPLPPAQETSESLLKLPDNVALEMEVTEFNSAMALLNKTIQEYESESAIVSLDLASCINESTSTLDLNPRDISALLCRASAYKDFGYFEEALEDLTSISFLGNFEDEATTQRLDELLQLVAENEADKLLMDKSHNNGQTYPVPSFLRTFSHDPVTLICANAEKVEKFLFPLSGADQSDPLGLKKFENDQEINRHHKHLIDFIHSPEHTMKDATIGPMSHKLHTQFLDLLTEKIALFPYEGEYIVDVYLMRGTFRHLLGLREGALMDYDAVIANVDANDEQISAAWVKKGILLAEDSNTKFTTVTAHRLPIKSLNKALALIPQNADAYFACAQVCLLYQNDSFSLQAALAKIELASELEPEFELFSRWKFYIRLRIASLRHSKEGIETALKEFEPPIGVTHVAEILRIDIVILAWMGHFEDAHFKLDHWSVIEKEDPRIYLAKLLLHELIAKDKGGIPIWKNEAFKLLEETLLNYGNCAQILKRVGKFALKEGLFDAAAECFGNALPLVTKPEEFLELLKLKRRASTFSQVMVKLGLNFVDYVDIPGFKQLLFSEPSN